MGKAFFLPFRCLICCRLLCLIGASLYAPLSLRKLTTEYFQSVSFTSFKAFSKIKFINLPNKAPCLRRNQQVSSLAQ